MLDAAHPWLYVRVQKPKSRRKSAKIQHVKIGDPAVLSFLQKLWQSLGRNEFLCPGSPAVFRRRWDKILAALDVPSGAHLTPASLRAGGAIHAFQIGTPVSDLLWRMRLK
ncbi:Ankrd17 [Symbiodinium pilosum]|uniref:Ankrd17 protein n=1 Tax=Symbiodinium pilosum TaxID=2952 RepID=A0A812K0M7_SYMPI|nr:Ankrd17 [Symbiodinium pilosum]